MRPAQSPNSMSKIAYGTAVKVRLGSALELMRFIYLEPVNEVVSKQFFAVDVMGVKHSSKYRYGACNIPVQVLWSESFM